MRNEVSAVLSPPGAPESPEPSLSRWSIASLVFLGLAIIFFLLPHVALPRSTAGPAEAAGLLIELIFFLLIAWSCTLAGAIAGWIGVRRSHGKMGFAWAGFVLNSWHCILGIVLVILRYVFDVQIYFW